MDLKINDVIKRYFENSDYKIVSEHGGEINKILIINIDEKEYALRSRPSSQDKRDLEFEYHFLKELGKHSLSVQIPETILTKEGNHYVEQDKQVYSLFTKVSGEQIFPNWHDSHLHTDQHLISGFRLLAKLHNVYRKISIPDYKDSPDEFSLLERFRKNLLDIDSMPEGEFRQIVMDNQSAILNKIQEIKETLTRKEYKNFQRHPVHYDLNFTNVLWKEDEIVSILDFDWAQYSTLEFDFCQACKLTGGLFSINGYPNEFLEERLKLALQTYNKYAQVPFKDLEILRSLLDISSLFLLNWSIEFFKDAPEKEDYFIHFFRTGFDRVFQKNLSGLL